MILGIVADVSVFRPFDRAVIQFQITEQTTQQGRLADTVRADDGNTFTNLNRQVKTIEQRSIFKTLAQTLHFQRQAIELLVQLETQIGILPARRLDILEFNLLNLPGTRRGLLGLGRIRGKPANESLQLGDL